MVREWIIIAILVVGFVFVGAHACVGQTSSTDEEGFVCWAYEDVLPRVWYCNDGSVKEEYYFYTAEECASILEGANRLIRELGQQIYHWFLPLAEAQEVHPLVVRWIEEAESERIGNLWEIYDRHSRRDGIEIEEGIESGI